MFGHMPVHTDFLWKLLQYGLKCGNVSNSILDAVRQELEKPISWIYQDNFFHCLVFMSRCNVCST